MVGIEDYTENSIILVDEVTKQQQSDEDHAQKRLPSV